MKRVHIDSTDYMCYTEPGEGRFEHEAQYLDDNEEFVEDFRYVPEGFVYIRAVDGKLFNGLMVTCLR